MDSIKFPNDLELKNIIDKLANFVARNGPEFEEMTKNKQRDNAKFSFLFGGEYHPYYKMKVQEELLNFQQNASLNASINSAPWQQASIMPMPSFPSNVPFNNMQNSGNTHMHLLGNQQSFMTPGNSQFYPNNFGNTFDNNPMMSSFPQNSTNYDQNYNQPFNMYNDNSTINAPWSMPASQNFGAEQIFGAGQNLDTNGLEYPKNFESLKNIGLKENILMQIKNSEDQLTKLNQQFTEEQQAKIDQAIINAQDTKIVALSKECQIEMNEIEEILKPVIETCTKEAISSAKAWILKSNITPKFPEFLARYVLKKVMTYEPTFEMQLHLIYLVNDLMHHCVRKNVDGLRRALDNIIIPIFCRTYTKAAIGERDKLDKLLRLWENNNYFKPDYLEDLKKPENSLSVYKAEIVQEYQALIDPIVAITDEKYNQAKIAHDQLIETCLNNPQNFLSSLPNSNNNMFGPIQTTLSPSKSARSEHDNYEGHDNYDQPQSLLGNPPTHQTFDNLNQKNNNMPAPGNGPVNPFTALFQNMINNSQKPSQLPFPPMPPAGANPMMLMMFNMMKNMASANGLAFPPAMPNPSASPNPMLAMFNMMMASNANALGGGGGGPSPLMLNMMKKMMETFSHNMNNPLASAPIGPKAQMDTRSKTIIPTMPYFDLPAGLMVNLVRDKDVNYKSLDAKKIRLPAPDPPTEQLLGAVEAFYSQPSHETPRNSEGWEHLGLFEFYKVKARFKKETQAASTKKESTKTPSGGRKKSRERNGRSSSHSSTNSSGASSNRSHSSGSNASSVGRSSLSPSAKHKDRKSKHRPSPDYNDNNNNNNNSDKEDGNNGKTSKERTDKKKRRDRSRESTSRRRSHSPTRNNENERDHQPKPRVFKEEGSDLENDDDKNDRDEKDKRRRRSRSRTRDERSSRRSSPSSSKRRHHSRSKSPLRSPTNPKHNRSTSHRQDVNNEEVESIPPAFFMSAPSGDPFAITDVSEQQRLDEDNKGHQLLKKMGWKGAGLGLNEHGIQEPISGGEVRERGRQFEGVGGDLVKGTDMEAFEFYRKQRCKVLYNR